jgi:tRNA G18 (ribose-2'-O)-methylase SpoU
METHFKIRRFDSPLSPEEFRKLPRQPITVVLDNLRSAFNVGSIFRTADSALCEKLLLCGITAHPPHLKLQRTAMGALDYVPWEYYKHTEDAVGSLKERGVSVVCLELTDVSSLYWEVKYPQPLCLVLGNEALGISRKVLERADYMVHIPMKGFKNSINVACAFSVVLFEVIHQWSLPYFNQCNYTARQSRNQTRHSRESGNLDLGLTR